MGKERGSRTHAPSETRDGESGREGFVFARPLPVWPPCTRAPAPPPFSALRGAHRKGAEDRRDTCCARRASQRFASPSVSPTPALLKPETLGRGEGPLARDRDLWDHMSSAYICLLFRSAQRNSCCSCHTYPALRSHLLAPFSPAGTRTHLQAPCLHTNLEEDKARGRGRVWIDGLRFPSSPSPPNARTQIHLLLFPFFTFCQVPSLTFQRKRQAQKGGQFALLNFERQQIQSCFLAGEGFLPAHRLSPSSGSQS